MAESLKTHIRTPDEIGVNFPFLITLEHPTLDVKGMFELTQAFDMYEMQLGPDGQHQLKEIILVDVLEVTPTLTTIKVTPAEAMPYLELLKHVDPMLTKVASLFFKSKFKVARLTWEIGQTGVASDLRGMLRKI